MDHQSCFHPNSLISIISCESFMSHLNGPSDDLLAAPQAIGMAGNARGCQVNSWSGRTKVICPCYWCLVFSTLPPTQQRNDPRPVAKGSCHSPPILPYLQPSSVNERPAWVCQRSLAARPDLMPWIEEPCLALGLA